MSPWHDILIFHLRNGSFQEENYSLFSPLPCCFLPGDGSQEWIRQRLAEPGSGEEAEAQEGSMPSFSFHSNSWEDNTWGGQSQDAEEVELLHKDFGMICMEAVGYGHLGMTDPEFSALPRLNQKEK